MYLILIRFVIKKKHKYLINVAINQYIKNINIGKFIYKKKVIDYIFLRLSEIINH